MIYNTFFHNTTTLAESTLTVTASYWPFVMPNGPQISKGFGKFVIFPINPTLLPEE